MSSPYCAQQNLKMPEQFEQSAVLCQLRYSGMLEMVKIRQAGFPVRRLFQDFYDRYYPLARKLPLPDDLRGKCASLLKVYDSDGMDWQLGKNKVFLRETLEYKLEKRREEELERASSVIRAYVLGYCTRKWYGLLRCSAVIIQRCYRAHHHRRRFIELRRAALELQKVVRGYLARRRCKHIVEAKQKEGHGSVLPELLLCPSDIDREQLEPQNEQQKADKSPRTLDGQSTMLTRSTTPLLGKDLSTLVQVGSMDVDEAHSPLKVQKEDQCDLAFSQSPVEETLQVEMLKDVTDNYVEEPVGELCLPLDEEAVRRLDADANLAAQEFLNSLQLDEFFQDVEQAIADVSLEDPTNTGQFPYSELPVDHPDAARPAMTLQVYSVRSQLDNEYAEIIEPEGDSLLNNLKQQRDEEEDEGLGVEDDGSFRETASKSVTPTMMPVFVEGLLSDQRTSGVRTCSEEGDSSSEEQFYSNEIVDPTCLKTHAFDYHSVRYSHPDFPVDQSKAHIYETVIPSAPPLPMTRCISVDYATVGGETFGFKESPPAYPGTSDENTRSTLRTPPPSYEPQEENIYSECHGAEESSSSSSSSSVFTCSSTTKFSITPNSQPVTIDYNYCISIGGAAVHQRSRHRSEGSANLYWRRSHSRDRYSHDCESPHVGGWSRDVSRWKRNQAAGRVKGTEWAGYRGVLGRLGSVGGSSSRTLLSSCDDGELEGEMQPDTDDELAFQEEDAYGCIGPTAHQGYLNIRDGVSSPWCRCWCVLDGHQFRWYSACDHPLYTGWLFKKRDYSWGGLARRRSGCRRWFMLCGSHLAYYDNEGPVERPHGHIDIRRAREILYHPEKEQEIEVVMDDQVHRLSAPNAKEARRLLSVLRQVHDTSELELQHTFQSSPKRHPVLGVLDISKDSAICTNEVADRPNSFGISTGCRSLQCDADTAEELRCWIALLHRSKADLSGNGHGIVMRGWLYKGPSGHSQKPSLLQLKRRWFMLNTDCLEYYRTCEPHSPIMGALTLTSLCSIVPPDEQVHKNTGYWNITVHGRKNSLRLYTKLLPEAARWAKAVQQVIDGKSQTETPTMQLMRDIAESAPYPDDVEEIYRRNSIINHSHRPLHSPLLPLPFGDIPANVHSEHGYTSLGDEAVRLFHCLLQLDTTHDPVPIMQGMLQTCIDLPPLRDELYCQLVKQTSNGGIAHGLRSWQVFACASCCFIPCSFVLQYLMGHLRRVRARLAGTEAERYVEFVYGAIERTRDRHVVPSRAELQAVMVLDEVTAMVYCHGGGSCQISISSHITAGEVVERLLKGLEMEGSRNRFALFEHGADGELAIESRTLLVDVLARFERVVARGEITKKQQPKIIFKIYCFLDTVGVSHDSIEFAFMFEQAHEEVLRGHFPASEENLQWLAALRLQFVHGNCPAAGFDGTELSLSDVYPTVQHVVQPSSVADDSLLSESSSKSPSSEKEERVRRANRSNLRTGLLRRSLRAAGSLSLRLRRQDSEPGMEIRAHDEPLLPRAGLLDKWRQLQGLDPQDASRKYMQLICRWPGYGSTIFDVLSTDSKMPRELWLGVSAEAVSIYIRGQRIPIDSLQYERIASFGVPSNNHYRLQVDDRELLFKTTQGEEMNKLMNAYISTIVKNRSFCSGTSASTG
uniref:unconventional myosin-X-like isoform X1 n=2 Tax=Myxine glutinosa TaxID=7769 RepID=UPI00358E56A0